MCAFVFAVVVVLLDLMQAAHHQWPTKLDDWNAMALEFNQRIEAMGFTPRNGKSLRKKWQVLCAAKQPVEGEELTEQEKRAKAINARGPASAPSRQPAEMSALEDAARKRLKIDHDNAGNGASSSGVDSSSAGALLASSPLAPVLAPVPQLQLPLTGSDNASLIAEVQSMLASRENAREQQVALFDDWKRRDEQERQQFDRLMQALSARAAQQPTAPVQQPQLSQPQQPQQPPQLLQGHNVNGVVRPTA